MFHHPLEDVGDRPDLVIMELHRFCEASQLLDQLAWRRQQTPQANEGPHDGDVDVHRRRRAEDAGEHRDAMLGEDPRRRPAAAVAQT